MVIARNVVTKQSDNFSLLRNTRLLRFARNDTAKGLKSCFNVIARSGSDVAILLTKIDKIDVLI
jgi:GTP-binding protein EngB required for normal cell division